MGRRTKGEGSIVKRTDGRWQGAYQDNGKRRYVYGKTRKEAAAKLREALWNVSTGKVEDSNITLEAYLSDWLNTTKNTLRFSTFKRYEQIVRVHLIPGLGGIKLKNLSPTPIQDLYQKKIKALSPRTVQYIHATLRRALAHAVRLGLLTRNVADLVDPPRLQKREITPLNVEEVNRLFRAIEGHPLEALFVLAVTTGLRRGEMLGLYWNDIDLDQGILQVKRSLALTKGGPVFNPPKTNKGKRSVRLSRICIKALIKHKSLQENNVLVFPNHEGEPRRSNNVLNSTFNRIKKKGNLPDIRFHDLRHTCATLLLGKGVHPKIVQELLGHSTISITLDTYSHILPNMQEKAVEAMEDIFDQETDEEQSLPQEEES